MERAQSRDSAREGGSESRHSNQRDHRPSQSVNVSEGPVRPRGDEGDQAAQSDKQDEAGRPQPDPEQLIDHGAGNGMTRRRQHLEADEPLLKHPPISGSFVPGRGPS